jgi:hypothetical protein
MMLMRKCIGLAVVLGTLSGPASAGPKPSSTIERVQARYLRTGGKALRLFTDGDCEALYAWAVSSRRDVAEKIFGGYLLVLLGDDRGEGVLVSSYPVDDREHWFGLGGVPGALSRHCDVTAASPPPYCRDPYEMLAQAAIWDWPGARKKLVEALPHTESADYAILCGCGVQGAAGFSGERWRTLAKTAAEREVLSGCLEPHADPVAASCAPPSRGFSERPRWSTSCRERRPTRR